MNGKTHIAIGTLAAVTVAPKIGVDIGFQLISGAAIGSLLLDLDHPKATINQKVLPFKNKYTHLIVYILLGLITLTGIIGIIGITKWILGMFLVLVGISRHRGFTHGIIGLSVIVYLCYQLNIVYGYSNFSIGLSIGSILHLIADLFTGSGVSLFYPFSNKRFCFPITIKTGSTAENVILVLTSLSLFMFLL